MSYLEEFYRHRELLWVWTWREIRVRYKQSILGIAWAVLQPMSLMLVFSIVFSQIIQIPTNGIPYPLFSYTAVLPWSFFSTSIAAGIPSLVNNKTLVTKVRMPREIIPVGVILSGLFDFIIAAVIFVGMFFYYRVPVRWPMLWVIPLLAIQFVLTLAIVFIGSALNILYRDIRFIIPLVTQLWMYATPIIYPPEMIPMRFKIIYYLNPMAPIIDGYRKAILSGFPPDMAGVGASLIISVTIFILSLFIFKRLEPLFADII